MFEKELFTPEQVVAGAKPFGSAEPREAAFNALAYTLQSESIVLIYRVVDDMVHYAGAPTTHFRNKGSTETPLYSVLGAEDGAYIIDEQSYSILIIKEGEDYRTYPGTYDKAREACKREGYDDAIEINSESDLETNSWESITFDDAKQSFETNRKITTRALLITALCSVIWVGMSGAIGTLKQSAYNYDLSAKNKIAKAIDSIPTYQPVDSVLADLSVAKSVAVKSGGWINRFDVRDNLTGLDLSMPSWVTRDYIAPLGQVKAETLDDGMMIRVFRELPKEK